jgi:RNA polymerase sigma-70 factor (ECF subfamily)
VSSGVPNWQVIALSLLAALAGCRGFELRRDDSPLPSRSAPARGGAELEVRAGEVTARPAAQDLGAYLGARLREDDEGVVVETRLRADTELEPGDRLREVGVVLPDAFHRHQVKRLADIAGYSAGAGWLLLELYVLRRNEERIVHVQLTDRRERVPARRWDPRGTFRRNGIELCALDDWPPELLPAWAEPTDHMVILVERGSEAGLAGLRPLDIVTNIHQFERTGRALVRRPDGTIQKLRVQTADEEDIWVPFLLSDEENAIRSYFGLGPLDALVHEVDQYDYDAATDSYQETHRSTYLSCLWYERRGNEVQMGVFPIFDPPRFKTLTELNDRGEPDLSQSWSRSDELEDLDRLLPRAIEGDRAAVTEVVRRHLPRVYGLCLRLLRSEDRAEEATQETFVRALHALKSLRSPASFTAWLLRIAANTAKESLRRRPEIAWDDTEHPFFAAVEDGERASREAAIERALAALTPEERALFLLHTVEGVAIDELAAEDEVTVAAMKSRVHRIREKVRDGARAALKRQGDTA